VDRPAPSRGLSTPVQRASPPVLNAVIGARIGVNAHFWRLRWGPAHIDPLDRPSMVGSRDNSEVSPSNIIEPTWETLPTDEQLQFEEHKEQPIQEATTKFLANFKVDRNNKVVPQRATDLATLRPTTNTPEVSDMNKLQSLKKYIDEQRDQMQNTMGVCKNIIGG
jgi:hypothetical protein